MDFRPNRVIRAGFDVPGNGFAVFEGEFSFLAFPMGGYMALFRSEVDGSDACIAMLLSNGQVLFQICAGVENGHNRLQVRDVFVLHGLKRHPGIVPNGTSVAPYPEPDFRAFAVEIFIKGMAGDLKSHAVEGIFLKAAEIQFGAQSHVFPR